MRWLPCVTYPCLALSLTTDDTERQVPAPESTEQQDHNNIVRLFLSPLDTHVAEELRQSSQQVGRTFLTMLNPFDWMRGGPRLEPATMLITDPFQRVGNMAATLAQIPLAAFNLNLPPWETGVMTSFPEWLRLRSPGSSSDEVSGQQTATDVPTGFPNADAYYQYLITNGADPYYAAAVRDTYRDTSADFLRAFDGVKRTDDGILTAFKGVNLLQQIGEINTQRYPVTPALQGPLQGVLGSVQILGQTLNLPLETVNQLQNSVVDLVEEVIQEAVPFPIETTTTPLSTPSTTVPPTTLPTTPLLTTPLLTNPLPTTILPILPTTTPLILPTLG